MAFDPERFQNRSFGGGAPPGGGSTTPPIVPPMNKPGLGGSTRPPRPQGNRKPLPVGVSYGGYTADQLRANPALIQRLGKPAAARWAAANPAAGPTPAPGPQPPPAPGQGAPTPTPAPQPSGPNPWAPPPPTDPGSTGLPGDMPMTGAFNDPFNAFMAAIPMMNLNRDQQIGDAMATAGFGPLEGNRFSSFAAGKAAEIGAQNALAQNALLQQTLSDYANRAEDRALQATGMSMGMGSMLDQMQQDRLKLPFQIGAWEQGRQDNFSNQAYQDFERNKLGWLPMLLQAAMSQGSGTPGSIYQTSTPAQPGAADWLSLLGQFFG